jgi:hypothetical protein
MDEAVDGLYADLVTGDPDRNWLEVGTDLALTEEGEPGL